MLRIHVWISSVWVHDASSLTFARLVWLLPRYSSIISSNLSRLFSSFYRCSYFFVPFYHSDTFFEIILIPFLKKIIMIMEDNSIEKEIIHGIKSLNISAVCFWRGREGEASNCCTSHVFFSISLSFLFLRRNCGPAKIYVNLFTSFFFVLQAQIRARKFLLSGKSLFFSDSHRPY